MNWRNGLLKTEAGYAVAGSPSLAARRLLCWLEEGYEAALRRDAVRDLQDLHSFGPLRSQNVHSFFAIFCAYISGFPRMFCKSLRKFTKLISFCEILTNSAKLDADLQNFRSEKGAKRMQIL